MKDNINQPAFPTMIYNESTGSAEGQRLGISIKTYACIHLSIPETGDEELDSIIRKANRNRIAEKAMGAMISAITKFRDEKGLEDIIVNRPIDISELSTLYANVLISELDKP